MSPATARLTPVGVFGGTFNPVHYGHLRSALELVQRLHLEQLRLMPCAVPPHREVPGCSAEHRAAMVELAVAEEEVAELEELAFHLYLQLIRVHIGLLSPYSQQHHLHLLSVPK